MGYLIEQKFRELCVIGARQLHDVNDRRCNFDLSFFRRYFQQRCLSFPIDAVAVHVVTVIQICIY